MIVYNTFEVSVVQAPLIWQPMSSWFDRAFKSKCLCVASLELLAHAAASTFFTLQQVFAVFNTGTKFYLSRNNAKYFVEVPTRVGVNRSLFYNQTYRTPLRVLL